MLWVVLDPSCRLGHHVFADSANNGPCGRALVEELIPSIEKQYRGLGVPAARFVTGHSSGGWSSLWLQVTYPDFFGGVWSTSPDPVDFRDFQRINIYRPGVNMFIDDQGERRPIARSKGKPTLFYKPFSDMDRIMGHGGQLDSFDAVFSPRGADGKPRPLWDRDTGAVDPDVAQHWEKYDIRLMLENNWKTLGPKLAGKLHVYTGSEDTFYLDGAVVLLEGVADETGQRCRRGGRPGRDHGNLIDAKMRKRINKEMAEAFKDTGVSRLRLSVRSTKGKRTLSRKHQTLAGPVGVHLGVRHKPDAPAKDDGQPSLARQACVTGHPLRSARLLPFGASGLTARAAVAPQRQPKHLPAHHQQHHRRRRGMKPTKRGVQRPHHHVGRHADDQHHRHDEAEERARPAAPAALEDLARVAHQAAEQPPHLEQALVAHQPDRRRRQQQQEAVRQRQAAQRTSPRTAASRSGSKSQCIRHSDSHHHADADQDVGQRGPVDGAAGDQELLVDRLEQVEVEVAGAHQVGELVAVAPGRSVSIRPSSAK